jgi:hypothetical protein
MPAQDVRSGQIAAEAVRRTFTLAVALGGTLWALSRVSSLFGPVPGPRLRKGELRARDASARAGAAYWKAEQAAAGGDCRVAQRAWKKAQGYRARADDRAARGDRTGSDLKKPLRKARKQLQLNCRAR